VRSGDDSARQLPVGARGDPDRQQAVAAIMEVALLCRGTRRSTT
jgi:hypothetical protein